MITDMTDFQNKGEIQYQLVHREADIEWSSCASVARDINLGHGLEVGAVTATCFPYTVDDSEEDSNDNSGHNS